MAIEPPSQSLLTLLQSLQLATPQQVLACQGFAKALCQDLPAFDSVWIDALVQGNVLTPFQAKWLVESPDRLRQGQYLLIDRLPHDGWPQRFLARPIAGGSPVTLAQIPVAPAQQAAAMTRLAAHLHQVRPLSHRGLNVPTVCESGPEALIAISPAVRGEALDELLVRRGRFPGEVAVEVARQLADALAALESTGALHGDLRLRSVLLLPGGRVQLVHSGLVAAAYPQVSIHWPLPIACHHGLAPELIGTHAARTVASECYALGCLLWQLLAGRPPWLPADPLQQMAAHQKGTVPDVRRLAPETPERLAVLIQRLVARDPRDRPGSLGHVARELGTSTSGGRSRLAAFQSSTQTLVPVRLGEGSRARRPPLAQPLLTAAVIAVMAGVFLFPQAGRTLLDSAGRLLSAQQETVTPLGATSVEPVIDESSVATTAENSDPTQTATPQPPTASPLKEQKPHSGQFVLREAGPYAASQHSAVGELSIAGAADVRAEIVVRDQPLRLAGETVRLAHLVVRRAEGSSSTIPLIEIEAQSVLIEDCELISGSLSHPVAVDLAPTIRWKRLDTNELREARLRWDRSIVQGGGPVMSFRGVPQQVQIADCAFLGTGPVSELTAPAGRQKLTLTLTRTTMRECGPLVQQPFAARPTPVEIELRQSLLMPRAETALIEAIGTLRGSWRPALTIEAQDSYLATGCEAVAVRSSSTDSLEPVDASSLPIEGLLTAEFQFAGPLSTNAASSLLKSYSADIQAETPPGFTLSPALVGTGQTTSRPATLRTVIDTETTPLSRDRP